ncbi:NAD(P)-binding protein [Hesseltinella vesiculosa]|uniref:NAD(P)-binding protein n=1 Tax=Hesseltinella vesiculosa TaxID=101127 RepID=A0A1X2GSP5_9FUNG|nr:NAD(P)-binding protein [Hesseltinella vesiculosa]
MSILITCADEYLGYALTSHFCNNPSVRPHLRVLCRDEKKCGQLRHQGVDVRSTDYKHPDILMLAMRNVAYLILVVGDHPDRVDQSRRILQLAARSGISSIILLSHIGALCANPSSTLRDYALVEDELYNADCAWTILRTDWLQQHFHLWTSYVEKKRAFPLPMDGSIEFSPIDIQDVCESAETLVTTSDCKGNKTMTGELQAQYAGQVYTLTGPRSVNGKTLLQSLSQATRFPRFQYHLMRPMDFQYYFSLLPKDVYFDARIKADQARLYQADNPRRPTYASVVFGFPSEKQVASMLDYFEWVGHTLSSICVPHVHLLTGNPPRSMDGFFTEHANSFKPLV